ncbi:MAG: DUF3307 domain-containing protein [Pseudomonadota bacterium]
MIETGLALLFAHVLADFVFQTSWIVSNKRNPVVLLLHGAIVLALSYFALGGSLAVAAYVALAHLAMDSFKTYGLPDTLSSFMADQAVHLTTIVIAAVLAPTAFESGFWADVHVLWMHIALLASGFILTVTAGGYAIGHLMRPYQGVDLPKGLRGAGMLIGRLERGLIFIMLLAGQPTAVGFLIAAKSFLRFDAARDPKAGEYVIVGTLASFGWALAVSWATLYLQDLLPPLEIGATNP